MGNLRYGILCCGLALGFTAATADAQTVEVGGSIGVSCKGSDGSFCNDTHSGLRTMSPYVGLWFDERLEIKGTVTWLRQPDIRGTLVPEPSSFAITDRRRLIALGEFIWHFRAGKRVRPSLGLGFGRYRDRETVTCEPADCQGRLSRIGLSAGAIEESHSDEAVTVGLSVSLHKRVRVHGGWRYHNPFKDELALSQAFVAVGFRPF